MKWNKWHITAGNVGGDVPWVQYPVTKKQMSSSGKTGDTEAFSADAFPSRHTCLSTQLGRFELILECHVRSISPAPTNSMCRRRRDPLSRNFAGPKIKIEAMWGRHIDYTNLWSLSHSRFIPNLFNIASSHCTLSTRLITKSLMIHSFGQGEDSDSWQLSKFLHLFFSRGPRQVCFLITNRWIDESHDRRMTAGLIISRKWVIIWEETLENFGAQTWIGDFLLQKPRGILLANVPIGSS